MPKPVMLMGRCPDPRINSSETTPPRRIGVLCVDRHGRRWKRSACGPSKFNFGSITKLIPVARCPKASVLWSPCLSTLRGEDRRTVARREASTRGSCNADDATGTNPCGNLVPRGKKTTSPHEVDQGAQCASPIDVNDVGRK